MSGGNRIEITDKDGWYKVFPLEKPLLYIGSDAGNDIVLEALRGGGVAPRHLQLIVVPGAAPAYRAINLANRDIPLGDEGNRSLAPRSALDITDGESLRLGEFALSFRLSEAGAQVAARRAAREAISPAPGGERIPRTPGGPAGERASACIGLRLSLSRAVVDPESPLEGIVTVRNLGNEPGVQFRLEVEGLERDYYEIGPGPILFPNVEKGVALRVHHPRGPGILAGNREITIRATAPEAYPGESVTVSQVLQILPFYSHAVRLVTTD